MKKFLVLLVLLVVSLGSFSQSWEWVTQEGVDVTGGISRGNVVAVSEGFVFVWSEDELLRYDENGVLLDQQAFSKSAFYNKVAVDGSILYLASSGKIYKIQSDGSEIWHQDIADLGFWFSGVSLFGAKVFTFASSNTGDTSELYCFDAVSGVEKKATDFEFRIIDIEATNQGLFVLSEDSIYILDYNFNQIKAWSRAGRKMWGKVVKAGNGSVLISDCEIVYRVEGREFVDTINIIGNQVSIYDIKPQADGFVVSGCFCYNMTLDVHYTNGGGQEIFVAEYSYSSSSWLWSLIASRIGDEYDSGALSLSVVDGAVYTTGHITQTNIFGSYTLSAGYSRYEYFLAKISAEVEAYSVAKNMDEVDPIFCLHLANDITAGDTTRWGTTQDLSIIDNMLTISGGSWIDLSPYLDNTDNQTLGLTGTNLSIVGGNAVDLSLLQDGFEPNTDNQNIYLTGNLLTISGGNSVDLVSLQDGFEANTDNQELMLNGNSLSIEGGNAVDLSPLMDNTDNQLLSLSGLDLSIDGGNTINLSSIQDGYEPNTDNQSLSLSGNVLEIDNGSSVDLAGFMDNTDNQSLSLSGNVLEIDNGSSVDLAGFMDNTDNQSLSLSGNVLEIDNGSSVDLAGFMDNTDNQSLNLSGSVLEIDNGSSVDLAGFMDNTDEQTLSLSGSTLTISGGNAVDFSDLVSFTESDPFFTASAASGISDMDISNWNIIEWSEVQNAPENLDNDPSNEIQQVYFNSEQYILGISDGNEVILPFEEILQVNTYLAESIGSGTVTTITEIPAYESLSISAYPVPVTDIVTIEYIAFGHK